MKFYEKTSRSIVKAISYKILIVIANSVIVFGITKNLDLTFQVLTLSTAVSLILYFLHERFWNKIHWGKSS